MPISALRGEPSSEAIADGLEYEIGIRAERYTEVIGRPPHLSIISGYPGDGNSERYMRMKQKAGKKLGIQVSLHVFDSVDGVLEQIAADNEDPVVNGTIVQVPLAPHYQDRTDEVLAAIDTSKDVDGLAPNSPFVPATPLAAECWLTGQQINFTEEPIVFVGLGRLVNKPLKALLEAKGARSTSVVDINTDPLQAVQLFHEASIIISAVGKPGLLTPDMFRADTGTKLIVDVGTAEKAGAQHGDVSDELRAFALSKGWMLTPQKGGIGPLTVRNLLLNTMHSADRLVDDTTHPLAPYRTRYVMASTSAHRELDSRIVENDRAFAALD